MYIRKWLNKKEGVAFIEVNMSNKNGGDIAIGDCHRKINLEFHKWHEDKYGTTPAVVKKQHSDMLEKFDILIETFQAAKAEYMKGEKE
jgi:hypothetical protein